MTYRALLIGNSVFDADASLQPLNAPVKDVARLHRALVDAEVGMFDDEQVRLVTERSCNDILDELDQFFDAGRRDDLLLLYYSGHGVLDEHNHLYLCGRDTRSDRLLRTAISNTRINEFIHQSVCQQTVILLDCCASGMFKGGQVGVQLAGPGRYIVSSTRGMALANDAATTTGTSLFTDCFVEGMLGRAADRDGDGYLDLRDVYDHVRHKLTSTSKQVPQCRFDGDGAVPMARVRIPVGGPDTRARREHSAQSQSFDLSETLISLTNVEAGEDLPVEVLEVYPFTDDPLDLEARGSAAWIHVDVSSTQLSIRLDPGPGRNRGKIVVRDRNSATTRVVRVEVFVHAAAGSPDAVLATKSRTTSTSTTHAASTLSEAASPGAPSPRDVRSATESAHQAAPQTSATTRQPPRSIRRRLELRRHRRRILVVGACLIAAAGAAVLTDRAISARDSCGTSRVVSGSTLTIRPCRGGYHTEPTTTTRDPLYSKPAATGSAKYLSSTGSAILVCRKKGMRLYSDDIWYLTKHGGWINDSYLGHRDPSDVHECGS